MLNSRLNILFLIGAAGFMFRSVLGYAMPHKGDAIVIGLMAGDIVNNIKYPLVYYGQNYMGATEAWITAPLFAIAGPSWWGLGFAPVIVSTIGVYPFYLLAKSLYDERSGYLAATMWAFAPLVMMAYNVTPRGCYPEIICGGAAMLWYATEKAKGNDPGVCTSIIIGVMAGALVWTSLLSAPYLLVMALFIIIADGKKLFSKNNFVLAACAIPGVILFFKSHFDFSDPGMGHAAPLQFMENPFHLIKIFLSSLASLYLPFEMFNPPMWANFIGWLAFITSAVFALIIMTAPVAAFHPAFRDRGLSRFAPLSMFTILFIALYLSNSNAEHGQARHVLPALTVLLIGGAIVPAWLWSRFRAVGIVSVVVIVAGLIGVNTYCLAAGFSSDLAKKRSFVEYLDTLKNAGIESAVWDGYDLAYQVGFEAMTRDTTFSTMTFDGNRNIMETLKVQVDKNSAFVIKPGSYQSFVSGVESCCGKNYKTLDMPSLKVIYDIQPADDRRMAESIPARLLDGDAGVKKVIDRKFATALDTYEPVVITLKEAAPVTKVRAIFGANMPQSVGLSVSMDGRQWTPVSPMAPASQVFPSGPKVFNRARWNPEREFQEWNFAPVMASFMRLDIKQKPGAPARIHEMFIYRQGAETSPVDDDFDNIAGIIAKNGVTILASDRWATVNLMAMKNRPFDVAWPSFRSADERYAMSNWSPTKGFGALTVADDAAELAERLSATGVKFGTVPAGSYTLFVFDQNTVAAWWTGFTLIEWGL